MSATAAEAYRQETPSVFRTPTTEMVEFFREYLNEQERLLIVLKYREQLTVEEISAVLDVPAQEIRQMHDGIVERVQQCFNLNSATLVA